MQLISPWLWWYLAIGTIIGAPLAFALQKAIQEEGTREPRSLLEKIFFEIIRRESVVERIRIELLQNRYVFGCIIFVAVFWFPLLCLFIYNTIKITIKKMSVIKYRILFQHRHRQFEAGNKKFIYFPTIRNAQKLEKRIQQRKNASKLYGEALQKLIDKLNKNDLPR